MDDQDEKRQHREPGKDIGQQRRHKPWQRGRKDQHEADCQQPQRPGHAKHAQCQLQDPQCRQRLDPEIDPERGVLAEMEIEAEHRGAAGHQIAFVPARQVAAGIPLEQGIAVPQRRREQHRGMAMAAIQADLRSAWIAAIAIPLMLLAPRFGTAIPCSSGIPAATWRAGTKATWCPPLHGVRPLSPFRRELPFWINLGIQALATLWILQLTLRVLGMARPLRLLASPRADLTTALPWLVTTLLTDIFAGLSGRRFSSWWLMASSTSTIEKCSLFALTAFAVASHSATLAVLLGLCCIGWIARPFLRGRLALPDRAGQPHHRRRRGDVAVGEFRVVGTRAWTPGGYGVAFGRMLQDGIVAHYLREHCPQQKLKLCPYRDRLPATADQFLWGSSMFNTLGRFKGLNDEMGFIVLRSLAEYPAWQARPRLPPPRSNWPGRHRRRHQ